MSHLDSVQPESQTRFIVAVQRARLAVYCGSYVAGSLAMLAGATEMDLLRGSALWFACALSALLVSWMYQRGFGQTVNLMPFWLGIDVASVSTVIYLSGGITSLWYIWYLAPAAAAAFAGGKNNAYIVSAVNTAAYLSLLFVMGQIRGFDETLYVPLFRMVFLFGASWLLLHGVSRITVRRLETQAMQRRLRLVIDTAPDAFVGMDAEGIIIDWNPQAERTFGWSSQEAVGRVLATTIIPSVYREAFDRGLKRFLTTGEWRVLNRRFESVALHREGREFPVEWTLSPVESGTTFLFYGYLRDITERRKAEEEIRKLNEDLEQRVDARTAELTAANQELEAFSYSISHDLRAPVRHISGYLDLLEKSAPGLLEEKSQRYVEVIRSSARHMGSLIDDLLAFSRIGRAEIRRTRINLERLVSEALDDLRPETEGRDISWTIHPLPDVNVDHSLLRSVLVNLISNAVKFTRTRSPANIEIGSTRGENEVVFFIRDNGVGFDMKYVHKLFGVFQRLHRGEDFEGTGIGLANVQRIIQRHGGRAWAEGSENQGAIFYVSLPD